jgi:hypothetical protein
MSKCLMNNYILKLKTQPRHKKINKLPYVKNVLKEK